MDRRLSMRVHEQGGDIMNAEDIHKESRLIMGVGNRLMMDDGIGLVLTEELKNERIEAKGLAFRFVVGETDVYYCMEQFQEGEPFLLLDATHFGIDPGTVTWISFADLLSKSKEEPFAQAYFSCHEETVAGKLIREEGCFQPDLQRSFLVGIEAFTVDYGIGLSRSMQAEFPRILEEVEGIMSTFCSSS